MVCILHLCYKGVLSAILKIKWFHRTTHNIMRSSS